MLAQPAARRWGMSSSVSGVSAPRTGCRKMSAIAWRRTSAPSRARVARGVSPGAGKDILPSVVIPPASAAAEPLVKSSTQCGPSVSSPGGRDRWTCASTPPGRTSIPVASMVRSPCRSWPITATVSPAMPMSAATTASAVAMRPPWMTMSSPAMMRSFHSSSSGHGHYLVTVITIMVAPIP